MTPAAPRRPTGDILVVGHHDLDGMVSGAIAGSYLRHVGCRPRYATVDFPMKRAWASLWQDLVEGRSPWPRLAATPPPDGVAIVDFYPTFVPESRFLLFADHHGASMDSEEVLLSTRNAMRRRLDRGEPLFHDGSRGSCAELLLSELAGRDGWVPSPALVAASAMAHASDTAAFPNAATALDFRDSMLARADMVALSLSEAEAAVSMAAIEAGADVTSAVVGMHPESSERILSEAARACQRYAEVREMVRDNVAVFDFTLGDAAPQRVKFAEFADPNVHYALQLRPGRPADGHVLIQGLIGRSPWAPAPEVGARHPDMATLAREIATGGGHPYAAGFQVIGRNLTHARLEAQAVASLIVAHLAPLPDGHRFADPSSPQATRKSSPIRLPAVGTG